jgi:hypothetical protein
MYLLRRRHKMEAYESDRMSTQQFYGIARLVNPFRGSVMEVVYGDMRMTTDDCNSFAIEVYRNGVAFSVEPDLSVEMVRRLAGCPAWLRPSRWPWFNLPVGFLDRRMCPRGRKSAACAARR